LTEVMMATAVGAIFLTGLIAAFVQVLKTTNRTEAVNTAVANGRVALDSMGVELKQANYVSGMGLFYGPDNPTPLVTASGDRYGNAVDDDLDGLVDEEIMDGVDNDGDWTDGADRHALVAAGVPERAAFVGQADLGDAQVDEDCAFESDQVTFWIVPSPGDPAPRNVEVTFSLGSFEGRDHVLLKTTRTPPNDPNATVEIAPLAENVLSFNALYWMPNGSSNYWLSSWNSNGAEATLAPGLRLPAAIHLCLQVYADERPIEMWRPGEPVKVETLSTVVTVEQIINDSRFPRP